MRLITISAVFILVLSKPSFCQNNRIITARAQSVQNNYANANVGGIISGKIYNLKYLHAINSQFYNDSYPTKGSLVYDGVFFPSIKIQYDLFIQKVIVLLEAKNSSRYVSIDTDKVAEFSIGEFRFVHITKDSIMEKGLHELGYSGVNSKVFIKRIKDRRDKTVEGKNVLAFSDENTYYVTNQFGTFHITNKKSLFNAYQNPTKIKELLKKNKIKISKRKLEQRLVKAVTLIDFNQ